MCCASSEINRDDYQPYYISFSPQPINIQVTSGKKKKREMYLFLILGFKNDNVHLY